MSYSSNEILLSLMFDPKDQMARFVPKTLRVCNELVVLTYCSYLGTEGVVAVTGEMSFDN